MEGKPRILVSHGYHPNETYAIKVGERLEDMLPDNVDVRGFTWKRRRNSYYQFVRYYGYDLAIDLHDPTLCPAKSIFSVFSLPWLKIYITYKERGKRSRDIARRRVEYGLGKIKLEDLHGLERILMEFRERNKDVGVRHEHTIGRPLKSISIIWAELNPEFDEDEIALKLKDLIEFINSSSDLL